MNTTQPLGAEIKEEIKGILEFNKNENTKPNLMEHNESYGLMKVYSIKCFIRKLQRSHIRNLAHLKALEQRTKHTQETDTARNNKTDG